MLAARGCCVCWVRSDLPRVSPSVRGNRSKCSTSFIFSLLASLSWFSHKSDLYHFLNLFKSIFYEKSNMIVFQIYF